MCLYPKTAFLQKGSFPPSHSNYPFHSSSSVARATLVSLISVSFEVPDAALPSAIFCLQLRGLRHLVDRAVAMLREEPPAECNRTLVDHIALSVDDELLVTAVRQHDLRHGTGAGGSGGAGRANGTSETTGTSETCLSRVSRLSQMSRLSRMSRVPHHGCPPSFTSGLRWMQKRVEHEYSSE